MPATSTIYARVSPDLKAALDAYAVSRGRTLASALSDLLARGLEAASSEDSIQSLEGRVQELEADLSQAQRAGGIVRGRLRQLLGTCDCGGSLTGHDLIVTGTCPECGRGVTGLIADATNAGSALNRDELIPFLAGVGAATGLLALLLTATK